MPNHILRSLLLLSVLVVSVAGFASTSRAQTGSMLDPGAALGRRAGSTPDMTKQPLAPPPAVPGASSGSDVVAPATQLPTDMSPSDALFDAINRGDIAAARDALSRGADLEAHNLLGMTPMELSVDLGRNDISFLLLSYRTPDTSSGAAKTAQANAAAPGVATKTAGAKRAGTKAAGTKAEGRAPAVAVKAEAPVAPQTPRLFANDGGTPVPGAGFLGFGSAAQSQR
jgi:hypothetical protein